jgi:hypothetical protein
MFANKKGSNLYIGSFFLDFSFYFNMFGFILFLVEVFKSDLEQLLDEEKDQDDHFVAQRKVFFLFLRSIFFYYFLGRSRIKTS